MDNEKSPRAVDRQTERINNDAANEFLKKARDLKEQAASTTPSAEAVVEAQKYADSSRGMLSNTLNHITDKIASSKLFKGSMTLDYTWAVQKHELLQEPENQQVFVDALDSVIKEVGLSDVLHAVILRETYMPGGKASFGPDDLKAAYTLGVEWNLESLK